MKKIKLISFLLLFYPGILLPQDMRIDKIEPPNWWIGMKLNKIQLMIYGENLNNIKAYFTDKKIKLTNIYKIENRNYAFADIEIPASLKPGNYKLIVEKDGNKIEYNYPINKRDDSKNIHQGFNSEDVIYLITPDRFANGNTANDKIPGMDEYNPNNPYGRHGGDIQGIIDHLGYLKDLGVTAVWINPLIENNTKTSYHGYSATDFYKIDPRFGTNELYKKLIEEAHKKNLKIILDHVNNHLSINHPWIKNTQGLPAKNWLNGSVENHFLTGHYKISLSDVYADSSSIINTTTGWFTDSMADLNQNNKFVKNYLIQNTIWWIEYSGLDGIREDTYPYSDQKYLAEWAKAILNEYPNFNIVGEVWVMEPAFLSYFQSKSPIRKNFDTHLPSVTDFGMYNIYHNYLTGKSSLYNIYKGIAEDVVYANPQNLVTFLDNHDLERAIYYSKGNRKQFEITLTMLLTTRGIPQIYYGSEIGLPGGDNHGAIREDFPGGFPEDKRNAFTAEGRTKEENELYDFTKMLLQLRQQYKALSSERLIQFPPKDDIFIFFKEKENEKIMILINGNDENKEINFSEVKDILKNVKSFKNLISGEEIKYSYDLKLTAEKMSASLYLLTE